MVQFLPQAKINIRPEPLNFKPVSDGLVDLANSFREKQEREQRQAVGEHIANNQYGQASQEAARQGNLDQSIALTRVDQQNQKKAQEEEKRIALKTAGFIQAYIDPIQNPQQKTMAVRRLISSHKNFAPALEQAGIDIRNPEQVVSFLKAQAQEFVDPRERQMQDAQLGLINAKTDAARARAANAGDRSKLVNMNGRLVRVGQDGTAQEIYQSPENKNAGPFKNAKQSADVEQSLRKEYASLAKPFFEVRDAFNRVEQSSSDPSAAGDLALIFNFMKMLDPGSVVREGEFATAQNAGGVPTRIYALYNNVLNGQRLAEDQRTDFVNQAQGLFKVQRAQYNKLQDQYRGISERLGVNPENTILNFGRPEQDNNSSAVSEARAAIAQGASREAVIQRLIENGIDPKGL